MSRNYASEYFFERKCAMCGKIICMSEPEKWAYKIKNGQKTHYFCSWHCLQENPERSKRGKKTNKKEKVFELLRQGKKDVEIMKELNCTIGTVNYWKARFVE